MRCAANSCLTARYRAFVICACSPFLLHCRLCRCWALLHLPVRPRVGINVPQLCVPHDRSRSTNADAHQCSCRWAAHRHSPRHACGQLQLHGCSTACAQLRSLWCGTQHPKPHNATKTPRPGVSLLILIMTSGFTIGEPASAFARQAAPASRRCSGAGSNAHCLRAGHVLFPVWGERSRRPPPPSLPQCGPTSRRGGSGRTGCPPSPGPSAPSSSTSSWTPNGRASPSAPRPPTSASASRCWTRLDSTPSASGSGPASATCETARVPSAAPRGAPHLFCRAGGSLAGCMFVFAST